MPTDLSPDLEDVLESDGGVCQFGLEHHEYVVVVFRDLLARRLDRSARELLELGDLLVQVRDVLLDNVGKLLTKPSSRSIQSQHKTD